MDKELEEAKIQIKNMIQNIQDSLDLDYLNNEQAIETCNKQKLALETVLNYIDNSIYKEAIEKKIEEIKANKNHKYTAGTVVAIINELQKLLEGK